MITQIPEFVVEFDKTEFVRAIKLGFLYVELKDELVGSICTSPNLMKSIVLAFPEEVRFDYIPCGIGMLRTAYLQYLPSVKDNEIRFVSQHENFQIRMFLI